MMNKNIHNGTGTVIGRKKKPFGDVELIFPVTFMLKAVMDATISDDSNKASFIMVFERLHIVHLFHSQKLSGKGNYISFTYKVTLVTKQQMAELYNQLKDIQGLKFAV